MRIVAGKWAGRHLTSPPDRRVRPTAEHVRDAWVAVLEPELEKARVLDLFAGTGALALEAMSRGAASADFVESRPASLHALRANVAALRVRERTRIFKKDALAFAAGLQAGAYDVAFADPPYASRQLDRLIETWLRTPFARILTVEHAHDHELPPGGKRRRFEETAVTTYRARIRPAAAPAAPAPNAPPRTQPPMTGHAATVRAATSADADTWLSLVDALADYEKLARPTPDARERLVRDAFGPEPRIDVWMVEAGGRAVGYAITFETYSSFLARPTLYLEDLFVVPEARGGGAGRAMFRHLAAEALRRGCARMEWMVLAWNDLAIGFYDSLGARRMDGWHTYRLTAEELAGIAGGGT